LEFRIPNPHSAFVGPFSSFGRASCDNRLLERAMGGVWTRFKLACAAFFTILFKARLPASLQPAAAVAPQPAASADRDDRAVQMIALLQRDGRLVDFLMEDLATYADAQIGAAVRDVHAGCRRALDRYLTLEPILDGREGDATTVATAFDPASVRLIGNVAGQPPFRGTLIHRGWRAARLELPPLGTSTSRRIVAQAEVEVA
jgi:hypothetical protein